MNKNILAKSISEIATNINTIMEHIKEGDSAEELELKILNETIKLYNIADMISN